MCWMHLYLVLCRGGKWVLVVAAVNEAERYGALVERGASAAVALVWVGGDAVAGRTDGHERDCIFGHIPFQVSAQLLRI